MTQPDHETDHTALKSSDFEIGMEFSTDAGRFRVTDVGSRVVVAICISRVRTNIDALDTAKAEEDGWFTGPPYAVAETVFDEYDLKAPIEIHPPAQD